MLTCFSFFIMKENSLKYFCSVWLLKCLSSHFLPLVPEKRWIYIYTPPPPPLQCLTLFSFEPLGCSFQNCFNLIFSWIICFLNVICTISQLGCHVCSNTYIQFKCVLHISICFVFCCHVEVWSRADSQPDSW